MSGEKNNSMKNYLKLFVLILGAASFYQIPYLRWTFYDGMMELSGLNNTQFALTMSVYGTVSMILYLPGGIIADKFSSKILVPLSLIVTGICGIILMQGPGYMLQMIVYAILAAAGTLTFWAALIKAVRNLDSGDGSKMLGLLEGGRGLVQSLFSAIFLAVFGMFTSTVGGVKAVLAGYAALNLIFGVISFFLLEDDKSATEGEKKTSVVQDTLEIVKMPAVWLLAIVVICSYSFYLGSTYMTPYFTNVIGATAIFSGALAIVRNYIAQMAGAPFGGILASRTKSTSLVVACAYIVMVIGIAALVILPSNRSMMIPLVVFMIIAALAIFVMRGIYFAIIGEYGIPLRFTGTAVGIVSVIGFTPDIFINAICGSILDQYEPVEGYHYIFLMMLAIAVIGTIAAWVLYFMIRRKKNKAVSLA